MSDAETLLRRLLPVAFASLAFLRAYRSFLADTGAEAGEIADVDAQIIGFEQALSQRTPQT